MAYEKTNWQDSPSTSTPINATNLNHIEEGLYSTNNAIDKIQVKPYSTTDYYPVITSSGTGVTKEGTSTGIRCKLLYGTTANIGHAAIVLGNQTESGTVDNQYGRLILYSKGTGSKILTGGDTDETSSSSSFSQRLPNLTGTVVVRQDSTISTETNGWYKVNMGAYVWYFKNFAAPSKTYSANGWGWMSNSECGNNLPSGITFNTAKMVFNGCGGANDTAILYNFRLNSGSGSVSVNWQNKYNTSVSSTAWFNYSLIVFP